MKKFLYLLSFILVTTISAQNSNDAVLKVNGKPIAAKSIQKVDTTKVKIGKNCNIMHGVTIAQANRGKHVGVPEIGNEVWIGTNAVIVGKIKVGNNVLIAPNVYLNTDVPDNSVVVGNPAQIISKLNATEDYINHKV